MSLVSSSGIPALVGFAATIMSHVPCTTSESIYALLEACMAQAWLGRVAAKILIAAVLITVAVPIGLQAQGGEDADALGDKVELGALNEKVGLLVAQRKHEEALSPAQRALEIAERLYGPDHGLVVEPLDNLAEIYQAEGRYADFEKLFKRALAINERTFGADHEWVAFSLSKLAKLYSDKGLYPDAEQLYRRSLAIYEKASGPAHPNVANLLGDLGSLYMSVGRYSEAEEAFKQELAITEKTLRA